ncbi:hypothetical protein ACZ76_10935 [Yersinia aleksiciae]|uniref:Uncharacterized protein n=1 Tax=Yersinia aleksiciae TaxID=263819 RepID=A0ABM5UDW0_YERAE|nr:hypothetical protein ACZ76_10935 [Yersinia aleksiciae]
MNIDLVPYHAQPGLLPFPKRWATMPWRDSLPLPAESLQDSWQSLLQKALPRNKRLLYLHIPFCTTFCGFYQNPLQPESTARYTDYLLRELSMEANSPLLQGGQFMQFTSGAGRQVGSDDARGV